MMGQSSIALSPLQTFAVLKKYMSIIQLSSKANLFIVSPRHIPKDTLIPVPDHIHLHYNYIVLCIDYYVNQIPFFHSISHDIKLCTTQSIPGTVLKHFSLKAITEVHGDNELFKLISNHILPILTHIAATGTKIPEVEFSICTAHD
jgi:hypothetical protein